MSIHKWTTSFVGILKTATFVDTSITTVGTLINGILGGIFYIALARFLGPVEFGIISVSILVLTLVADVADLGLDTSIVRFVGKYKNTDKEKAERFLKLSFMTFLIVSIVIMIVGVLISEHLSELIFQKAEFAATLRIAFVGVITVLLFSFVTSTLQAYEKYMVWSSVNIVTNLLRILAVLVLFSVATLTTQNAMFTYILMPLIGFVGGILFIPRSFIRVKNTKKVSKELFNYTKWVAGFSAIAAVSSRLDVLMTARLLSTFELGIYAAAARVTSILPQIVAAFGTAVAPKFASIDTDEKAKEYTKKLQVFVGVVVFVCLVLLVPVAKLIPVIFGVEYTSSIQPFVILTIAMLIFLFSVPVHQSIFYYFAYPRIFLWLALINMIIVLIGGYYAINSFGIMGAATVVLTAQIVNFIIPLVYVLRKFR
ncbi:oligosaccharide flippase family protein [Patescibacteria group bacterium]